MFIRKKKIGRNWYYYLVKSTRISKNKWKKIEKYIGKELPPKKELKELENEFDQTKDFIKTKTNFLKNIKSTYENRIKNATKDEIKRIDEEIITGFTYNTTRMEGGKLSYDDTALLLNNGITPKGKPLRDVKETENHKDVCLFIKDNLKKPLNKSIILKLHKLLKQNITEDAGRFRNANISIGNFIPVKPSLIEEEIKNLLSWYNKNKNVLHPLETASIFHSNFERIHPFFDGNGRVGRLLLNFILMKKGFPPIIIQNKNRKRYYKALRKADAGNYLLMLKFLFSELEETVKFYKK